MLDRVWPISVLHMSVLSLQNLRKLSPLWGAGTAGRWFHLAHTFSPSHSAHSLYATTAAYNLSFLSQHTL
jgi:hypothetical protein